MEINKSNLDSRESATNNQTKELTLDLPTKFQTQKQPENLDEILTMPKSESDRQLPTNLKQNGAQHLEGAQNEEHESVFFTLQRAFCCLQSRRCS